MRKLRLGHGVDGGKARAEMLQRQPNEEYTKTRRRWKVVEASIGGAKVVASLKRARHVGRWNIKQRHELATAPFNLVQMRTLLTA